ncbi:hypothetical protein D1159_13460 [Pseudoflavonifractor sp. 524-17]|uniref:hypothetical protein n=1 Tax=Pseudoflavonifractor sp. 524-17 TaxID=2304577 RepID=UPI00137A5238|nr:hypothetical protein [Pseudoflavonifractor sp. 524-17]NCE65560.1 hypothetical protein [Pseudoflavonifractor sp. 524-17]
MRDISEKRTVELRWSEVGGIVSEEIKEVLGLQVPCKVNVIDGSFWDVTFINCRLPLPKLCQLLQATQATPEDWEDALPDEGGVDVGGIGIVLAEKLISRHLKLTWEHHLITTDSLWLVGVADIPC